MCIIMASCNPCERLSKRCPAATTMHDSVWIHDSVWVEHWQTDTVVKVLLKHEIVEKTIPTNNTCQPDSAFAETSYAQALSFLQDGNLILRLKNKDSAEMLLTAYHTLRNAYHEALSSSHAVQVQTVYKCRPIIQTGAWIGLAAIIYILVRIVLFMRSKILGA